MSVRLNNKKAIKAQKAFLMVDNFIEKVYSGDFDKKRENDEKNKQDENIQKRREKLLDKFKSYSVKIPTMIKVNGLINTLAFIKGKSEKVYKYIYENINYYYIESFNLKTDDIIKDILSKNGKIDSNNMEYQRVVTAELLSYLVWVKRFAVSEITNLIESKS